MSLLELEVIDLDLDLRTTINKTSLSDDNEHNEQTKLTKELQ